MKNKAIRKLIKKYSIQGNQYSIEEVYETIFEEFYKEFTEDNIPTILGFLLDRFFKAFQSSLHPTTFNSGLSIYKKVCLSSIKRTLKTENIKPDKTWSRK